MESPYETSCVNQELYSGTSLPPSLQSPPLPSPPCTLYETLNKSTILLSIECTCTCMYTVSDIIKFTYYHYTSIDYSVLCE